MILSKNLLFHLHGLFIGINIASFLLVIFFAISYYNKSNRQTSFRLMMLALTLASCAFYELYLYNINAPFLLEVLPSFLTGIGKYTVPIAGICFIYTHTNVLEQINLDTYKVINRVKSLIKIFYASFVVLFFALFFVKDLILVVTINHLAMLFVILFSLVVILKSRKFYNRYNSVLILLVVAGFSVSTTLYEINFHNRPQTETATLIGVLLYTLFFAYFAFLVTKFSKIKFKNINSLTTKYQHAIAMDLHEAISRDHLYMVYQPKLCLQTNTVNGVEALIRWQHPKHGFIPPSDFIPVIEKTGMINEVTLWVVEKTLQQALEFQRQNLHIPIAINLSADNLNKRIVKALDKYIFELDLHPSMINLEITETFFLDMNEEKQQSLDAIHDLRVSLSLDDYGTGYSSLSYLQKISLKELKIDAVFIKDLTTSREHFIIVDSIIQMSKALNISVTAEGVETKEIKDILHNLGCHTIQGYYLSKPDTIDNLMQWMNETGTLPQKKLFNLKAVN